MFIDHIGAQHGIAAADIGIIAQSVGAVTVATWVHDYAPAIRGMVLASPAFGVKLYVPLALPGLRLMRRAFGNFFVPSYVKAKFLTRDLARTASYGTEPLLSKAISVNVRLGLQEAADREEADAYAAPLPVLSPRGLYWSATRAGLRFGGLLADGVRLGHATGFDSGSTLDYVYRDRASGRTPVGRPIDRTFLDAIGWRGEAWVMRRRTQEEMDRLVAAAGFRKAAQRIGESGIFTVALAQCMAG